MNDLLVYKFGGSSLADVERFQQVADIIGASATPLVVVCSAVGGITDQLEAWVANHANPEGVRSRVRQQHTAIVERLELPEDAATDYLAYLDHTLGDLSTARELDQPRRRDLTLSIGERLAANLMAALVSANGLQARYVDSREIVRTDDQYGSARVDLDQSAELSRKLLPPLLDQGIIPVVTGFLGSTASGDTTTIGRNGSDLSATMLGRILNAREVWIWTDVDGLYTADPRYYEGGHIIPQISYREAAEAAYFGAKIIHPHTLWPVLDTDIAVRVKNTFAPERDGTQISQNPKDRGDSLITTSIEHVSAVTVGGYGMVGLPGIAARLFTIIAKEGISVYMISQSSSEHNITLLITDSEVSRAVGALNEGLSEWIELEHKIERIRIENNVVIISVVGERMKNRSGIAGRIFASLGQQDINVIAIAQGSSQYSISFVVLAEDQKGAISAIHTALKEDPIWA